MLCKHLPQLFLQAGVTPDRVLPIFIILSHHSTRQLCFDELDKLRQIDLWNLFAPVLRESSLGDQNHFAFSSGNDLEGFFYIEWAVVLGAKKSHVSLAWVDGIGKKCLGAILANILGAKLRECQ